MIPKYLQGKKLPRHLEIAISFIGVKEFDGKPNNPKIIEWGLELGLNDIYKEDSTAWCGLFFAIVCKRAKRELPQFKDPYDYLRALKYVGIWQNTPRPAVGDVLVFQRPSGGHIGFYVAESKTTYYVLGGNQNNSVNITEILKSRCVATRRPLYNSYVPFRVILDSTGNISTNEA